MRARDHAVARSLSDAEFTPAQADAITNAVRLAAEHGDHVTSDQFTAGVAEVRTEIAAFDTRLSTQIADVRTEIGALDTRLSTQIANLDTRLSTQTAGVQTEIANLETRLIRWMVGTVIATATLTVGILVSSDEAVALRPRRGAIRPPVAGEEGELGRGQRSTRQLLPSLIFDEC